MREWGSIANAALRNLFFSPSYCHDAWLRERCWGRRQLLACPYSLPFDRLHSSIAIDIIGLPSVSVCPSVKTCMQSEWGHSLTNMPCKINCYNRSDGYAATPQSKTVRISCMPPWPHAHIVKLPPCAHFHRPSYLYIRTPNVRWNSTELLMG